MRRRGRPAPVYRRQAMEEPERKTNMSLLYTTPADYHPPTHLIKTNSFLAPLKWMALHTQHAAVVLPALIRSATNPTRSTNRGNNHLSNPKTRLLQMEWRPASAMPGLSSYRASVAGWRGGDEGTVRLHQDEYFGVFEDGSSVM
ncbi:hypothetical protein BHE74_00032890 [Ensete ventricosum]|uniref:Uncharacterized protein n=1 Tax=Ensete ventricosum TaxID=4639 RepID=A0A444EBB7_ENSVE|nr:hypothetical protein GW17_00028926 [Ensete ventricosum]RWW60132.1 hypothetical protein BHE74_00032890 [Ensete ventricosum]RZR74398.1 hypothetical protein BHM03_00036482 [Ensete ventricosum]